MSTWKLYQKILPIFSFQHIDSETLDENILYNYKELFSRYLKEKSLIPKENLIEFGYNKFINTPVETLKETYEKLQIPQFEKAKPFFEKYVDDHRNYKAEEYQFNGSLKKKIYKNWKIMFDAYGYEQ